MTNRRASSMSLRKKKGHVRKGKRRVEAASYLKTEKRKKFKLPKKEGRRRRKATICRRNKEGYPRKRSEGTKPSKQHGEAKYAPNFDRIPRPGKCEKKKLTTKQTKKRKELEMAAKRVKRARYWERGFDAARKGYYCLYLGTKERRCRKKEKESPCNMGEGGGGGSGTTSVIGKRGWKVVGHPRENRPQIGKGERNRIE